jgi:pimeloyl-ACP methyl ester carboxylesterase
MNLSLVLLISMSAFTFTSNYYPKALSTMDSESMIITSHGATLPAILLRHHTECVAASCLNIRFNLVLGHGLGAKNPGHKDHTSDDWLPIVTQGAATHVQSILLYTARGHKGTSGWENTADSDPELFTWKRLAADMLAAADSIESTEVLVGGSSMGSATALYATLQQPSRVKGLIMIRPPAAWEQRRKRRTHLLGSAANCHQRNPEERHYLVLKATAYSDLPSLDDPCYATVTCPVLILAVRGDDAHPLSTARGLHEVLPHSQLEISQDMAEASHTWPAIVARFIESINRSHA